MAKYLIKLTPHDTFFFGDEKGFGTTNENYFVKSRYFPQQTALLGLLRFQLLKNSDCFKENEIINHEEAKRLIGKKSFIKGEKNNFGVINAISPVFLIKENQHLFPVSKEFQKDKEGYILREISDDFSLLENYNSKLGLPELWSDGEQRYSLSEIFQEVEQIGIRKNKNGQTDDKAFYQQTFMKFKEKTAFAFYADINTGEKNELLTTNATVVLGGEQKTFLMEIEEIKKEISSMCDFYQNRTPTSANTCKVVLLSDAYIEDVKKYCDFAITDTVSFRSMIVELNEKGNKFYTFSRNRKKEELRKNGIIHKSGLSELYTRGSVFYFTDEEKMKIFTNKLQQSEFYKIGYNYFKIINKK